MKVTAVRADSGKMNQSAWKDGRHDVRNSANSPREIEPLINLAQRIICAGDRPSMEGLAGDLASMPLARRQSAVLSLQRSRGNRFVQRLAVQAQLMVGAAGDKYEQEAERVANQAMRMTESPEHVQRQEAEEEEIQAKPLAASITPLVQTATSMPLSQKPDECEEEIQTKQISVAESFEAGTDFESRLSSTRGSGSPLPDSVRGQMEENFGADFSGVRVHSGSEAAQLNREVSAQAFTHGQDIYLGEDRYDPSSSTGQRLLAHELVHLVQQSGQYVQPKVIQRYKIFNAGTYRVQEGIKPSGAMNREVFASQGMEAGIGQHNQYTRSSKTLQGGQFMEQNSVYDPNTRTWQNPDPAQNVPLPSLKVSNSGYLAIENTRQPKVFYIDENKRKASNKVLNKNTNNKKVQLKLNGPSMSIPWNRMGGLFTTTRDLKQVTLEVLTSTNQVAQMAHHQCDEVAKYVAGSIRGTPKAQIKDKKAHPEAGQTYHIAGGRRGGSSEWSQEVERRGGYSIAPVVGGDDELTQLLNQLDNLDQAVNTGMNVAETTFDNKVKLLFPVWGEHFEGVVARDGNDSVTLANYNRKTELKWTKRKVFNYYYKTSDSFRTEARNKARHLWNNDSLNLDNYQSLSTAYLNEILNALQVNEQTLATELDRLEQTLNQQATQMWYFSMYGKGEQSFHAEYSSKFARPETKVGRGLKK